MTDDHDLWLSIQLKGSDWAIVSRGEVIAVTPSREEALAIVERSEARVAAGAKPAVAPRPSLGQDDTQTS